MISQLSSFTDLPNQQSTIVLADGSKATLALQYFASQSGWFFSITYGANVYNNIKLAPNPNILRQFQNVIPFGLMVLTAGDVEIVTVEDLINGVANLYLLDAQGIADVENGVFQA